jgi:hypothetical protein
MFSGIGCPNMLRCVCTKKIYKYLLTTRKSKFKPLLKTWMCEKGKKNTRVYPKVSGLIQ